MADTIPFEKICELAEQYKPEMTRFLRDMVRIPSESCQEGGVIQCIKAEMEKVGFDKVEIDPMGNVIGTIGHGKRLIAMDGHVDTVGVGVPENWTFDPYEGYEDDACIGGRGTSDQEGGMASMVYAGKIIKDLGLEGDYTLIVTGTIRNLRQKPDSNSRAVARVEAGVIGQVLHCSQETVWCEVEVDGFKGWLRRIEFWGVYPEEAVE